MAAKEVIPAICRAAGREIRRALSKVLMIKVTRACADSTQSPAQSLKSRSLRLLEEAAVAGVAAAWGFIE
ncbi:hypothetical protein PG996_006046 [Apiospora saccharicola]|uniref:Uncharacterized protein n=1 Tax=Apiospora saccharicola TaxID=335842 RepID=A0ABR1VNC2_9PEZI